jgi:hypothetical protein
MMATTRFAPGQKVAGSPRPKGRGMCPPEVNSKAIAAVEDNVGAGKADTLHNRQRERYPMPECLDLWPLSI